MKSTETLTHPLDLATALERSDEGVFLGHTAAGYSNMVGPFGGLTAATLLRAVLDDPRRVGDPLSITVNFAGPIADGPFTIDADPVRTNRTTQHWMLTLRQHGAVATTATVVSGLRRQTWTDTEISPPTVPAADSVPVTELPEFPSWLRNYEMRFIEGTGPVSPGASEQPTSTTTLWVRDTPARTLDFLALTSLGDVFFPRVMVRRGLSCPPARCRSPPTSTPGPRPSPPRPTARSSPPPAPSTSATASSIRPRSCGPTPGNPWRSAISSSTSRTDGLNHAAAEQRLSICYVVSTTRADGLGGDSGYTSRAGARHNGVPLQTSMTLTAQLGSR